MNGPATIIAHTGSPGTCTGSSHSVVRGSGGRDVGHDGQPCRTRGKWVPSSMMIAFFLIAILMPSSANATFVGAKYHETTYCTPNSSIPFPEFDRISGTPAAGLYQGNLNYCPEFSGNSCCDRLDDLAVANIAIDHMESFFCGGIISDICADAVESFYCARDCSPDRPKFTEFYTKEDGKPAAKYYLCEDYAQLLFDSCAYDFMSLTRNPNDTDHCVEIQKFFYSYQVFDEAISFNIGNRPGSGGGCLGMDGYVVEPQPEPQGEDIPSNSSGREASNLLGKNPLVMIVVYWNVFLATLVLLYGH